MPRGSGPRRRYLNGERYTEDWYRRRRPPGSRPPRRDDEDTPLTPPPSTWLGNRAVPQRRGHQGRSAWMRWLEANRFRGRLNAPVIQKDKRKSLLAKYPGGNPGVRSDVIGNLPGSGPDKPDPRNPIFVPPSAPPGTNPDMPGIGTPYDEGGVPVPSTGGPGSTGQPVQPPTTTGGGTTSTPPTTTPPTTTPPTTGGPRQYNEWLRRSRWGGRRMLR